MKIVCNEKMLEFNNLVITISFVTPVLLKNDGLLGRKRTGFRFPLNCYCIERAPVDRIDGRFDRLSRNKTNLIVIENIFLLFEFLIALSVMKH